MGELRLRRPDGRKGQRPELLARRGGGGGILIVIMPWEERLAGLMSVLAREQ